MIRVLFLSLLSVFLNAQSLIDFEQLNCDTTLTTFISGDYEFTSPQMATNYGDNLDVDGTSLFLYGNDITITRLNNVPFYAHNLRAYQVSEVQGDVLTVEGWIDTQLVYQKTFAEIDNWQTLNLNYIRVTKLIFKPNSSTNDYNLDNISLGEAIGDDTTSVIKLQFDETMSIDSLLYKGNYKVICNDTSDHKIYRIHQVAIIKRLGLTLIPDTTMIALITDKIPYSKLFNVSAKNIKDRAGNLIDSTKSVWLFNSGFAPDLFDVPELKTRKE